MPEDTSPAMRPKSGATSPLVSWHPFHSDPEHSTVVVSADGVHFRASAFRLAQFSDVFKAGESRDSAIALFTECNSDVIEIYLDACQGRPIDYDLALRPPILRPLVRLLIKTGSLRMRDEIFSLDEETSMLPCDLAWSLAYASRLQDETWAATCICKLAQSFSLDTVQRVEHVRYILGQCNQEWQTVLFDILLTNDHPRGSQVLIRQDWEAIATEFEARIREMRATTGPEGRQHRQGRLSMYTDERGEDQGENEGEPIDADSALEKAHQPETADDVSVGLEISGAGSHDRLFEEEGPGHQEEAFSRNRAEDDVDMSPGEALRTGQIPADVDGPPTAKRPHRLEGEL